MGALSSGFMHAPFSTLAMLALVWYGRDMQAVKGRKRSTRQTKSVAGPWGFGDRRNIDRRNGAALLL
jgi:hypothetical protein